MKSLLGAAMVVPVVLNLAGCGGAPRAEPAPAVDARAASEVPSEPPFGPDGFLGIELGMSREELSREPGVRFGSGNDQCERFSAPGVSGWVQPGLGVAVLATHADLETPDRLHVGSTLAEVRSAHPRAVVDRPWVSVPSCTSHSYRFQLAHGRVVTLMLLHDDQHCGG